MQQCIAAVQALQSHTTSADDRKAAEQWLLAFQRTDDSWGVAKELLQSRSTPSDVQLFATQMLKNKARQYRDSASVCTVLQKDILQILHQHPQAPMQQLQQLCLGLASATMPLVDALESLVGQMSQSLPLSTCLLTMEALAEEVAGMLHFGHGTSEERTEALTVLKGKLRAHARSVYSWLSRICGYQQLGNEEAAFVMRAFNAWIRLCGLLDIQQQDSHSLVSLALAHLQNPNSQAFEASADALSEVIDHCPHEWFSPLHDSMISMAAVALKTADGPNPTAAEHICRVVATFASIKLSQAPLSNDAQSADLRKCLMQLALLPAVADNEPVCGPALQAWIEVADAIMNIDGSGYEPEDDTYYDENGNMIVHRWNQNEEDEAAAGSRSTGSMPNGSSAQHANGHGPGGGQSSTSASGLFQSASDVANSHTNAHTSVPDGICNIYEELYLGLLKNMVAWQQPGADAEVPMDSFTPTCMSLLGDCMGAVCNIIGANRFVSLLWMYLEQAAGPSSQYVATAALQAVAAAGRQRLTQDAGVLHVLSLILARAACMENPPTSFLVPFCCAVAATGRQVLVHLHQQRQDAEGFLTRTFNKLVQGLVHADDTLDLHRPSALAIKGLMQGAQDAQQLCVPLPLVSMLVSSIQHQSQQPQVDVLMEQHLIIALSIAVFLVQGDAQAKHNVEVQSLTRLVTPLHTILSQLVQQLQQSSQPWEAAAKHGSVDTTLGGGLRLLALLIEDASEEERPSFDNGAGGTLQWLLQTFLQMLWPQLSLLISKGAHGSWLAPLCKCLAAVMRARPQECATSLPSFLEALVNVMPRPGGTAVSEPAAWAMELYSSDQASLQLLQQVMQHILSNQQVLKLKTLGAADSNPDFSECFLRLASAYAHHTLAAVAAHSEGGVAAANAAATAILEITAASSCCNHKQVAAAALQCTAAVLGAARAAAAAQQPQVLRSVTKNGGTIMMGLIGGLLSTSPLVRLPKITAIMIDLTSLAGFEASNAPQLVSSWLVTGLQACQLPQEEAQAVKQTWPAALQEAATGLSGPSRQAADKNKQIKKLLRDFADIHSRQQL